MTMAPIRTLVVDPEGDLGRQVRGRAAEVDPEALIVSQTSALSEAIRRLHRGEADVLVFSPRTWSDCGPDAVFFIRDSLSRASIMVLLPPEAPPLERTDVVVCPADGGGAALIEAVRRAADRPCPPPDLPGLRAETPEHQRLIAEVLAGRSFVCMFYSHGEEPDWTFEQVLGASRELTGYDPEELIGNQRVTLLSLAEPGYSAHLRRFRERSLRESGYAASIYALQRPDGELRWVADRGRWIFRPEEGRFVFQGVLLDLNRWRLVHDVRERARQQHVALGGAQGELLCRFGPDARLVHANDAFLSFFDPDPSAIKDLAAMPLLPAPVRHEAMKHAQGLGPDAPEQVYDQQVRREDGAMRWVRWRLRLANQGVAAGQYELVGQDTTELLDTRRALSQREQIVEAVAFAAERLLREPELARSAPAILRRLGEAANCTWVGLGLKDVGDNGRPVIRYSCRWAASGVESPDSQPRCMPWAPGSSGRADTVLEAGRTVHGSIQALPSDLRDALAERDVASVVLVPIQVDGWHVGHIRFEDTRASRRWLSAEIDGLRAAADMVGAALERQRSEAALRQARDELEQRVRQRTAELETANADLRSSEEAVRALLDAPTDLAALIDTDGVILSINATGARYLGDTPERLIGQNAWERFDPVTAERRQAHVRAVIRTGRPRLFEDRRLERTFMSRYFPVFGADGRVDRIAIFARDISRRRELEKQITQISAREQRRIGSDLHDGVCQQLAGVSLMSQTLLETCRSEWPAGAEDLDRIVGLLETALKQVRSLSRGLQPVVSEPDGLPLALAELAEQTRHLSGTLCTFRTEGPMVLDDPDVATHLYRIAQEAVNNAIKHSGGRSVAIDLVSRNGELTLGVIDDGVGLPDGSADGGGMGLNIMRFRARMIDAELELLPRAGGGTVVRCTRPGRGRVGQQTED